MNGWTAWGCLNNRKNGKGPGRKAPAPSAYDLFLRKESEKYG